MFCCQGICHMTCIHPKSRWKNWSGCQSLEVHRLKVLLKVKLWSNYGQTMVKVWSKYGQRQKNEQTMIYMILYSIVYLYIQRYNLYNLHCSCWSWVACLVGGAVDTSATSGQSDWTAARSMKGGEICACYGNSCLCNILVLCVYNHVYIYICIYVYKINKWINKWICIMYMHTYTIYMYTYMYIYI